MAGLNTNATKIKKFKKKKKKNAYFTYFKFCLEKQVPTVLYVISYMIQLTI